MSGDVKLLPLGHPKKPLVYSSISHQDKCSGKIDNLAGFAVFKSSVKILRYSRKETNPPKDSHRGDIKSFSNKSKARLKFVASNSFPDLISQFCLTYHETNPTGKQVKRDIDVLMKYVRHAYPVCKYLWILEFQTSGKPHFHLFLTLPYDYPGLGTNLANRWNKITKETPEHLRFHSHYKNFIPWDMKDGSYLSHKYLSKQSQKVIPEGFEGVGRFWAHSRGLVPPPKVISVKELDFYQMENIDTDSGEVLQTPVAKYICRALCKLHEIRLKKYGIKSRSRKFDTNFMLAGCATFFWQLTEYTKLAGQTLF